MAAEDFFKRWSKPQLVNESATDSEQPTATVGEQQNSADHVQGGELQQPTLQEHPISETVSAPTLEDVAQLETNSDFSRFMAKDVDEEVKRSAMKKLFSDPHFNIMDGLDIYIDDYSKPDPLPPGMLEKILHADALLNPLRHLETPLQTLLESEQVQPQATTQLDEVDDSHGCLKPPIPGAVCDEQIIESARASVTDIDIAGEQQLSVSPDQFDLPISEDQTNNETKNETKPE